MLFRSVITRADQHDVTGIHYDMILNTDRHDQPLPVTSKDQTGVCIQAKMAGKDIKYGVKARESILVGVNTLANAVTPETPMEEVITHVVWGMALLVAGFFGP